MRRIFSRSSSFSMVISPTLPLSSSCGSFYRRRMSHQTLTHPKRGPGGKELQGRLGLSIGCRDSPRTRCAVWRRSSSGRGRRRGSRGPRLSGCRPRSCVWWMCDRELRQLRGRRASEPHKPARSARGNRACRARFLRHRNGNRLRRDLQSATGRPARHFVAVRPEESAWV